MYIPPKFGVDDSDVVHSFIRKNPFGLLLSVEADEIHDTHTPFIISNDGSHLLGHIARANPHWKSWNDESSAKVIFTGPHTYISPKYYASVFNVPTWNYTAVSVAGKLTIIDDENRVIEFLEALTAQNEHSDSPWKLDRNDVRYRNLLSGIVVFSISLDRVEASFKLNQNKSTEDQEKVIQSLQDTGCPFDGAVSSLMTANIEQSEASQPGNP